MTKFWAAGSQMYGWGSTLYGRYSLNSEFCSKILEVKFYVRSNCTLPFPAVLKLILYENLCQEFLFISHYNNAKFSFNENRIIPVEMRIVSQLPNNFINSLLHTQKKFHIHFASKLKSTSMLT